MRWPLCHLHFNCYPFKLIKPFTSSAHWNPSNQPRPAAPSPTHIWNSWFFFSFHHSLLIERVSSTFLITLFFIFHFDFFILFCTRVPLGSIQFFQSVFIVFRHFLSFLLNNSCFLSFTSNISFFLFSFLSFFFLSFNLFLYSLFFFS